MARKGLGGKVVLGVSGLLLVADAVRSQASVEVVLAIIAGAAVAGGVYLIAPSARLKRVYLERHD